jgi:hypothetical protein
MAVYGLVLVCRAYRLGRTYGYGLHPVYPDGERAGYHRNSVLSNNADGGGGLCPFGTYPLGDREQTALGIGCSIPGEDYARNRKDHSAANLTLLRKMRLNLIRLEPTEKYGSRKFSLNRKRLYASYEPDFLLKILLNL